MGSGRLYLKGAILGFRRGQRNQYPNISLIKIQGVDTKQETDFYLGKRVAYIYRVRQKTESGTKTSVRVIWGKVVRAHGNSGAVRARFRTNLPPKAHGAAVRVMLYPSRV